MRGSWASWVVLVGIGFGCGCSREKAEPAPNPVVPNPAVATVADVRDKPGKVAGGTIDAGPTDAAPKPGPTVALRYTPGKKVPIESLFNVMYTPDEALPEQLRRRIRFRLKDKSRAPIALHHIIDIPKPDGSREVFALYESSVYEDCVQGYANRKEGRDHCLGEFVEVVDGLGSGGNESSDRANRYRYKQVRLNRACVALGAVRAVFGPPGPEETADTGGSLAITSIPFTGALCEVSNYNRLLVADVDGDKKLEMYVDLTTAREELGRVRGSYADDIPKKIYNFQRHLYVLSGDDMARVELSLDLDSTTSPSPEPPDLIEFRDIDRDGHLDVIETKPCYWSPGPGAFASCESAPEATQLSDKRIAYLYDVEQDAYKEGVAMEGSAEKAVPTVAPSPTQQGAAAPPPESANASKVTPNGSPAKAPSSEVPDARAAAMRLHDRAMKALAAKQLDDAAQIWREAAATDPTWSWPPYNLACVAALRGHPDDAIAQLRRVIDRGPDVDLLRRLDTDHDLGPLRDLPAFQELVGEVAKVVLARDFHSHGGCSSMSFTRDGAYTYSCAACCSFTGTYAYAKGRLQLEIAAVQREAMNGPGEPRPIHVRGTYRLREEHGKVCFDRVAATGDTDDLPLSPLPNGCWE